MDRGYPEITMFKVTDNNCTSHHGYSTGRLCSGKVVSGLYQSVSDSRAERILVFVGQIYAFGPRTI